MTYKTVNTGVDDGNLDLHGQRLVLTLLCTMIGQSTFKAHNSQRTQELSQTGTTGEQKAGGSIEIGTELSKCSDFTVLSEVEFQGTSKLLHDLAENGVRNQKSVN